MKRLAPMLGLLTVALVAAPSLAAEADAEGWYSLFDGQTLTGWKASENPDTFSVQDGAIIAAGPRSHLFYVGDVLDARFRNFEFEAKVLSKPGANSGIYFHTAYQDEGWPNAGYEVQINNTQPPHGNYYEYKKTGSLYGVRNQLKSIAPDDEWYAMKIVVRDKQVRVYVNGERTVDYVRPDWLPKAWPGVGTFAFQGHDPDSVVMFKDVRVRPLADDMETISPPAPIGDELDRRITELNNKNFPLCDLHIHLKGGLTLDEAIANSQKVGIYYGIAVNCGLGFPVTDDEAAEEFFRSVEGKPCFIGMQAEGREWVDLFSRETREKFDYVFTDAMTWTDDAGNRMRLWIPDEVIIGDKERFMDTLVARIEAVMAEPIDIYANPLYLPAALADEFDTLWTAERQQRVIDAAVRHGVAMEISARLALPRPDFIKKAKAAGVKFTFGTNNTDADLGRLEYCLRMIDECGLRPEDMWLPNKR